MMEKKSFFKKIFNKSSSCHFLAHLGSRQETFYLRLALQCIYL